MKVIQIRNVPDHVHRELRTRAAAAGVSLSDYALEELTDAVEMSPVSTIVHRPRRGRGTSVDRVVAAVRATRETA